jgi:hypothetical protein
VLKRLLQLFGFGRATLDDQIRGVLRWSVPDGLECGIGYDAEHRCLFLGLVAPLANGVVAIPPGEPVDGAMRVALDEAARIVLAADAAEHAATRGDGRRHDEAEVRAEERSASPTGCDDREFQAELRRLRETLDRRARA